MLEISHDYLSLSKFVNDPQKTNALLYDAFIQRLRLPLEVFKKLCKCLWKGEGLFYFLIICAMVPFSVPFTLLGFNFECATCLIFIIY